MYRVAPFTVFNACALAAVAGLAALAPAAQAGVIVTEDQSATAWPDTDPTIDVAGGHTPDFFTTGVGIPDGGSASQTFTVVETFTLDKIDVAYSTSASSGTVGLRLQEAAVSLNGGGTAYEYSLGSDLFATANLSFTYSVDTDGVGVITLDFTGGDQVTLEAGKTYAIEFIDTGTTGTGFGLRRRGGSYYGGGYVFSNRSSVNGTAHRDAGMQIFAVPEPATLALVGAGGVLCLCRRRAAD